MFNNTNKIESPNLSTSSNPPFDFNPNDFSDNDFKRISDETCKKLEQSVPISQKINLINNELNKKDSPNDQLRSLNNAVQTINNYFASTCIKKDCLQRGNCVICYSFISAYGQFINFMDENPWIPLINPTIPDNSICNAILLSEKNAPKIPFNVFPNPLNCNVNNFPTEIKIAILHLLVTFPKKMHSIGHKIIYGKMLDVVHLQIFKSITKINPAATHAQNGCNSEQTLKTLNNAYYKELERFYSMNQQEYAQALQLNRNLFSRYESTIYNNPSTAKLFHRLTAVLLKISHTDPIILDKLAILFAKIFMGRKLLNTLKIKKHATLIISNNPYYINNFLFDILTFHGYDSPSSMPFTQPYYLKPNENYHHITNYSAKQLCDPTMKETLIEEKIIGNIVNIDKSQEVGTPEILKKLIDGTPLPPEKDAIAGSLIYRSNAHYIFLRDTASKKLDSDILSSSDILDLSAASLDTLIYEQLSPSEIHFMVTGFVDYGINCLLSEKELSETPNSILAPENFIKTYCTFTNTENDFSHIDILYNYFVKLQNTKGQTACTKNDLRDYIKEAFPFAAYEKKKTPRKDGKAFLGLKFNEEKLLQDIESAPKEKDTFSKEVFLKHFSNICQTYSLKD
ncbi:MAG: hypothetical protein ACRC76_14245 [Proteocatella sp.]